MSAEHTGAGPGEFEAGPGEFGPGEFIIPTYKSMAIPPPATKSPSDKIIYFCGNSLGLMPKTTPHAINLELTAWGDRAVESHFNHPNSTGDATNWVDIDLPLVPLLAPLVGGKENEVAVMGTLTMNLNSLLISFYKPVGKRTKILFEKQSFPSDYYAFVNLVKLHGFDESHLIQLEIPSNQTYLNTQDILDTIDAHAEEIAIICLPGIQYYTGQWFDMETITKYAKTRGITVGWDLAHAVGNVPLKLHDWEVDFACWCSYKYLNSGPGGIAGIFVNEVHTAQNSSVDYPARLAGWWGNNSDDRFKMLEKFDPINLALSYRQSNPSVIDVVSLKSSLKIFQKHGLDNLREKSIMLTNTLANGLIKSKYYHNQNMELSYGFKILTPLNEFERGCQLSILFSNKLMEKVLTYLRLNGVICDERRPNVIRLAPVPLYNDLNEVEVVIELLEKALNKFSSDSE